LTTLAYEHWSQIHTIIGSDIDTDALNLAERNLSLLTLDGLDQRLADVKSLSEEFGKDSHVEAIKSGLNLRNRLVGLIGTHSLKTHLFQADSTNSRELQTNLANTLPDLVITDIPYGEKASWQGSFDDKRPPVWHLLDALQTILHHHSVVAIVTDKKQKVAHENYTRLSRIQIGKRRIFILKQNSKA
jgi:23S rRNA G2445 N2-methylase RlmL